jgi:hypothetical protein
MKKGFTSPFIAASAAVLMGTVAGAQGGFVAVNIRPAAPFDVVIFSAANAGKVVARTDEKGKGHIDAAALANLGKVVVYEEKCEDGTRVALVAEGSAPDANCKNRRVGSFWFGHDSALDVGLSGGLSTGVKASLIGGGGAAVALVALKGGSPSNPQTGQVVTPQTPTSPGTTTPPTTPTPPTPPTPPAAPTVSSLYGTFNMSATKTSDSGCNFNQSFTGQAQISGNTDGSRIAVTVMERLSRAYSGSMQSNGTFSASGSGNLDGYAYSGQISGQVSGNSVQATEVLYFSSGCPGKQVVYRISGSK